MRVVWIGAIDPGGISNMYARAVNEKYKEHEVRVVTINETRGFDSDLSIYRDLHGGFNMRSPESIGGDFKKILEWSDTVIFNIAVAPGAGNPDQKFDDTDYSLDDLNIKEYCKKTKKKCFGFYFGSTSLRRNYKYYIDICKKNKWKALTCQPDIFENIKKTKWPVSYVPILVNQEHPRYRNSIFDFVKPEGFFLDKINIAHSPTDKRIKNTQEFINAIQKVNSKHQKECYGPVIIDNHGMNDALTLKKMCHVAFDQMQINDSYYCLSSVENTALGLINIVALNDTSRELIRQDIGCDPPWEICNTEDELFNFLDHLYENRNEVLYARMKQSYEFARNEWSDKRLIHKLVEALEK